MGEQADSAPAIVTPPAAKVRHPSQVLLKQRQIRLVDVKYYEDNRPKNQLEAFKARQGYITISTYKGS
eukprot:1156845-Pelagomonas_calceolata.AAC.9